MEVALYFGSFNPIHIGHIAICRYLLESTPIDQLRLIVSPQNPLKENSSQESGTKRLEGVERAVERASLGKRVLVSDLEYHLPPPLYTIETLKWLRKNEPENNFILVIGADNLAIIERWYRWEELLKQFPIWVYPREGFNLKMLCERYGTTPLEAPLVTISSTQIREREAAGEDMSRFRG